MPWDGELPHDWYGLGGLVVVALVVIIMAQGVGGAAILRYHRRNDKDARQDRETIKADQAAIKEQVSNGHPDPLRMDLDRMAHDIVQLREDVHSVIGRLDQWSPIIAVVRSLTEDVRGLRSDLAEERSSRRELAADVRADMAHHRDEVHDLHRQIIRNRDAG